MKYIIAMAAVAFAAAQARENQPQPPQRIIDMLGLVQDDSGAWVPSRAGPGGRRLQQAEPEPIPELPESFQQFRPPRDVIERLGLVQDENGNWMPSMAGPGGRRLGAKKEEYKDQYKREQAKKQAKGGDRRLQAEPATEQRKPPQHIIDMLGLVQDENGHWIPSMAGPGGRRLAQAEAEPVPEPVAEPVAEENRPPQEIIDMLGLVKNEDGLWMPSGDGLGGRIRDRMAAKDEREAPAEDRRFAESKLQELLHKQHADEPKDEGEGRRLQGRRQNGGNWDTSSGTYLSCNLGVQPGPGVEDVWGRIGLHQNGVDEPWKVRSFYGNLEVEEEYTIELYQGNTCESSSVFAGEIGEFTTRASRRRADGAAGVGGYATSAANPPIDDFRISAGNHVKIIDSWGMDVACCTLEAQ